MLLGGASPDWPKLRIRMELLSQLLPSDTVYSAKNIVGHTASVSGVSLKVQTACTTPSSRIRVLAASSFHMELRKKPCWAILLSGCPNCGNTKGTPPRTAFLPVKSALSPQNSTSWPERTYRTNVAPKSYTSAMSPELLVNTTFDSPPRPSARAIDAMAGPSRLPKKNDKKEAVSQEDRTKYAQGKRRSREEEKSAEARLLCTLGGFVCDLH
mmetsp:Transcript_22610/g.52716  ORF Transcript_22610/g.52716 Transcript_22610/m.52716 type:complete len:212 (-) Transcript_22610:22-657(-)